MNRSRDPFEETGRLLQQAKQGDRASLSSLIRQYEEPLLGRVRKMMGTKLRQLDDSRDVLQDLFLDILKDYDPEKIRTEEEFLRWAAVVVRNNIHDAGRRARARGMERLTSSILGRGLPDRAARDPGSATIQRDEQSSVESALRELPEHYRRVIELRDIEQLSYKEVARELGDSSESAARKLYVKALARLTTVVSRGPPPSGL